MGKPCGCRKSQRIKDRAERAGRPMTRHEAAHALAHDLEMTPDELQQMFFAQGHDRLRRVGL